MIVSGQVHSKTSRFPVNVDGFKKGGGWVIRVPKGSLDIDILRQGPGEIRPGQIVGPAVKHPLGLMICQVHFRLGSRIIGVRPGFNLNPVGDQVTIAVGLGRIRAQRRRI